MAYMKGKQSDKWRDRLELVDESAMLMDYLTVL
jgi:hypothetical protein